MPDDSQAELVVLVPHETLVEGPDPIERRTPIRRKRRAVDVAFVLGEPMPGVAHAERVRHRGRNRATGCSDAAMYDGTAHAPRLRMGGGVAGRSAR